MDFSQAERLNALPPYLFSGIARRKREAIAAGRDIIDFGVGDPDLPTPEFIVRRMRQATADPANHRYPADRGSAEFRQSASRWFGRRFGVEVDEVSEVLMVIGTKEALAHMPLASVNPGEVVLVPSPGYPVYRSATIFAGGLPVEMPLTEARHWLPDFEAIPADAAQAAKLMYLNYPNNPTGAVADLKFFEQAVAFAQDHDILIVHDAAYSELTFEKPAPSILQVAGGKDQAIEMHSLSKTFNMTGWRIGFATGQAAAVAALAAVKSNIDSAQFNAIQLAAIEALDNADHVEVRAMQDLYRERRDVLVDGLRELGWEVGRPTATFYVWMAVPYGGDAMAFATRLLEEADVVVVPGAGFGKHGERYVRLALTVPSERIRQALARLARLKF